MTVIIRGKRIAKIIAAAVITMAPYANTNAQSYNQLTDDGTFTQADDAYRTSYDNIYSGKNDSTRPKEKVIPKGLRVWTVDELLGDVRPAVPDTLSHNFQNTIFTTGTRGEFNSTGNLGAPRINRIFVDRPMAAQFPFTQPYDYFNIPVGRFLFTNTLSPITNLTYNECGDRTNGEDHLTAKFGVNAGKKIGVGFVFDYIYGRGYYQEQSTSHFNYSMYGSYIGEQYNAHLLLSTNHQKVTENGGITDDRYITHPEIFDDNFSENEIPTVLSQNWNRNDNQHVFFTQRYSLGMRKKVKMTDEEIKAKKFALESMAENEKERKREEEMKKAKKNGVALKEDDSTGHTFTGRLEGQTVAGDEPEPATDTNGKTGRIKVDGKAAADSISSAMAKAKADSMWYKTEYIPVTSFIHTLKLDHYRRIYQAYQTPENFYADTYDVVSERTLGDSIYDKTQHLSLRNTLGVALLEGFNKWAKAGIKIFGSHELRHFSLPRLSGGTDSWNEHNISVGGMLSKAEGRTLHYSAMAEAWIAGEDAGQLKVDASADLNFRLFGDTVRLEAKGYFYRLNPSFYFRHYQSKHLWWSNSSLDKEIRSRIEGVFTIKRTRTSLRVAFDDLKNYTYYSQKYSIDTEGKRTGNTVSVRQNAGNISLLTLQLCQDFRFGPFFWENCLTYQNSSNKDVIPVPAFNAYTNLFVRFKIARVLKVDLGADARYFTKYYAPDYSPLIGQYTVQDNGAQNIKTGNYPIVNVYANMHLKQTRFFIMMSHVNAGNGESFLTPHYPVNSRILRFGLSWNFFN